MMVDEPRAVFAAGVVVGVAPLWACPGRGTIVGMPWAVLLLSCQCYKATAREGDVTIADGILHVVCKMHFASISFRATHTTALPAPVRWHVACSRRS